MAALECLQLVKSQFPSLDEDLSQYVESVLETSGEDFESADDIFEAIGAVLGEVANDKTEDDIKDLCDLLLHTLKPLSNGNAKNSGRKLLDAPVHMGAEVAKNEIDENLGGNAWIQKVESNLRVDSKALEKAQQELAKKAKKKDNAPTVNTTRYRSNEATASQVLSKKAESGMALLTKDIRLEGFDVAFGEKVLLKNADMTLTYGRRYGMVGRNGLGKSTLLRMMSSRQLVLPGHLSILHVEQEVVGDETLALQSVLESDTVRESLLAEEISINKKLADGTGGPELSTTRATAAS